MAAHSSSRYIALALLVFSFLALIVGLFNAGRLAQEASLQAEADGGTVSNLLNQKNRLALIEVSGVIMMDESNDSGLFRSQSNAVMAREALKNARENDSVKGVLLRINSPGGTVAMSQELHAAVLRVSEKKPVVVSMGDVAASGGYYAACAADKIFVNPGTLTASIGVIISTMDASELLNQKLGVEAVTIKSGQFKDLLSPYRKPKPEELALVQKLVNDSYQDFVQTVIDSRTRLLTDKAAKAGRIKKILSVADGRIVHGREAVKTGLADEIGGFERAYEELDRIAKLRFNLKSKDLLPLEKEEKGFSLLSALGLEGSNNRSAKLPVTATVQTSPAAQLAKLVPISWQFPNQPLWIME